MAFVTAAYTRRIIGWRCGSSMSTLAAQSVYVADRLTSGDQHGRDVHQHLARAWTGVNERRDSAVESPLVKPTRSASSRTATFPACATTPDPSAVRHIPKTAT